ncbi:MAG: segregation and condensation protein A, partial [Verrucomicrobiia bacterium]
TGYEPPRGTSRWNAETRVAAGCRLVIGKVGTTASMEADYKVKLEVFEGPLDLLLYLIKKEEVDIYDIPIERITNQYMEYLTLMQMLNLEVAGEFLVMAATLMYIKSRMLLPADQQVTDAETEEGEDPRWELIRQLVEYKKFKDAGLQLGQREEQQANIFSRGSPESGIEVDKDIPLAEVSIFDLINAFNEVLKKASAREDFREIIEERFTVSDKIEEILYTLRDRSEMIFGELFANASSRAEVVVTFLALLELIRLKRLKVVQVEAFGEIRVLKVA